MPGSWVKKQREYNTRLNRTLYYIEHNLDRELSLEVVSKVSGFSSFHFHRIFRAMIGETLSDYVKRLRLERAAILLEHNPFRSVTEIALDCGFSSSSNFARAFKERFGVSATEWREGESIKFRKIRNEQSKKRKADSNMREDLSPSAPYNPHTKLKMRKEHVMKVEVKQMPEIHIAYVRCMKGYSGPGIAEAWEKVCRWAGARGLIGSQTKFIGISYDDPDVTPQDKCRYDACVSVPKGTEPDGEINVTSIPAGRYAVSRFEGQPQDIKPAYDFLYGRWMPDSGFQPGDSPCLEIYLNDPKTDPKGRHVFEMCIPVKPL
ncbi:AraC family transcriptional regulator [bacterium]|nr:AraC family transcriptional regulator [bacterium]